MPAGGIIQVWDNGWTAASPEPNSAEVDGAVLEASTSAAPAAAAGQPGADNAAAGGAAPTAQAASPATGIGSSPGEEEEEGLDDEELATRAAAAAAEAEAEAAAAAAAAEAAAAEAVAAAARAAPKPVAPGIRPRLFVVDAKSGSGYEVLAPEVVERYAAVASTQPGHQHLQQEAVGSEEPGTICHTFLNSHTCRSCALQPLELAQPTQVLPIQVQPEQSLVSLRRVQTVVQAEWQTGQGLKLPRIAALNPWHLAAAAAGSFGSDVAAAPAGLAATRLQQGVSAGGQGSGLDAAGGQVVVVREFVELPVLGPEVQEKVQAVLESWQSHR